MTRILVLLVLGAGLVACSQESSTQSTTPVATAGTHTPATVTASYVVLDEDLGQVIADFNADRGRLRLVFIVGPTCGICLRGMADLNDEVVAGLQQDMRMETYVIHVPTLGAEEKHVEATMQLLSGPRIHHYWDAAGHTGVEFQKPLDIPVYAWDIWMIYGPDAYWEPGNAPPKPDFWQHQLGNRSFGEILDKEVFAAEILARIGAVDETSLEQRVVSEAIFENSLIPVAQPRGVMIQQNLLSRGGYAQLKSITGFEYQGSLKVGPQNHPISITTRRPNHYQRQIETSSGIAKAEVKNGLITYSGDAARVLPQALDSELLAAWEFDGWLLEWKDKGHKVRRLGMEKDAKRLPWIMEVKHRNGQTWRLYVDSHSGDTYRKSLLDDHGQESVVVNYGDYRDLNGFRVPHQVSYQKDGMVLASVQYDKISISTENKETIVTR